MQVCGLVHARIMISDLPEKAEKGEGRIPDSGDRE